MSRLRRSTGAVSTTACCSWLSPRVHAVSPAVSSRGRPRASARLIVFMVFIRTSIPLVRAGSEPVRPHPSYLSNGARSAGIPSPPGIHSPPDETSLPASGSPTRIAPAPPGPPAADGLLHQSPVALLPGDLAAQDLVSLRLDGRRAQHGALRLPARARRRRPGGGAGGGPQPAALAAPRPDPDRARRLVRAPPAGLRGGPGTLPGPPPRRPRASARGPGEAGGGLPGDDRSHLRHRRRVPAGRAALRAGP